MKSMIKSLFAVTLTMILLAGCGLSTEKISETVKISMQQKFDSDPQLKKWHLTVTNVQVLKQSNNQFQGIATVMHEGESHDVPVQITADGSGVMWQSQPGAFMFAAQKELEKEFKKLENDSQPLQAAAPKNVKLMGDRADDSPDAEPNTSEDAMNKKSGKSWQDNNGFVHYPDGSISSGPVD